MFQPVISLDRMQLCARSQGSAEAAFEMTLEYVRNRRIFGQRLIDFQNTQFKLAEMETEIAAGRLPDRDHPQVPGRHLHRRRRLDAEDLDTGDGRPRAGSLSSVLGRQRIHGRHADFPYVHRGACSAFCAGATELQMALLARRYPAILTPGGLRLAISCACDLICIPRAAAGGVYVRLKDKVAFIRARPAAWGVMARRFATQGAKVVLAARRADKGNAIVEEIRAAGGQAAFHRMDQGRESDVEASIDFAVREFGTLNVLVNNAGPVDLIQSGTDRIAHELSTEAFDRIVKVTLYGAFWCCKYALPHMIKAGAGSIVNVSSIAAVTGLPMVPAYSAAKGGLSALTRRSLSTTAATTSARMPLSPVSSSTRVPRARSTHPRNTRPIASGT